MQFTKLRLSGFKSFVDPTELDIQPGVSGVVGPNGCGKSNLVEALKWVMGETSAKQMRGGEMDDVIFSGTANRPSRNVAEVVLALDNADRTAPAQFNDFDDLEVSRKIEREKGSTYKVNAKEVRARDVHLLFADQASGARSTALVSQGKIGEVVSAKPTDRRKLLEEAAGITGLHSRRHEAELRLRGAETNLERLDDVMVTLEAQMQSLRKQVRQATRYRNLNDHIRKAEATFFLIRWKAAAEELEAARQKLNESERVVGELTGAASSAAAERARIAETLPQLRNAEAEAAAGLQRLSLARENLEEEEGRLESAKQQAQEQLEQITRDIERETTLAADANAALTRLEGEKEEITGSGEDLETPLKEAGEKLESVRGEYQDAEAKSSAATESLANTEARRADLTRRCEELTARVRGLSEQQSALGEQITTLEANAEDIQAMREAESALSAAGETLEAARTEGEAAVQARIAAGKAQSEAQDAAQQASREATKLEAEESALAKLLENGDPDLWPPLVDALQVEVGYETALGTALGDDLSAATDEAAPVHWRSLPALGNQASLPLGATPLSNFVTGSPAIKRRLSQVGVVEDAETGWRLLPQLRQGQRLVTKDGAFWRWDGYTAASDSPGAQAVRLEQRNRLKEIRQALTGARRQANEAEAKARAAKEAVEEAGRQENRTRDAVRAAEAAHAAAQARHGDLRQKTAETDTKLSAQKENAVRIAKELEESKAALTTAQEEQAGLRNAEESRREAETLKAAAEEKRGHFIEAQSAYDILRNQAEARQRRLETISQELSSWTERKTGAAERGEQLQERKASLEEERERLNSQPDEIKTRRQELMDRVDGAEQKRKDAADSLAEQETKLAEADKISREAEAHLSSMREQRVRAESAVEQAKQGSEALTERMQDRLSCRPDALRELSGLPEDADLPELEAAEKRVERLLRERENMGPVNLRAEAESQELSEQIEALTTERDELLAAIDKLRRGINQINREGRQRLLDSFEQVDKHFQELFVRLFGGGRAHLTLTESDDPLEAGIEIMASPPGKRLQVLSLLSGGEQALTALALLFGVFLTNPAPICVLDEVDAPLDDANVDRFCTMVSEIAHSLSTRFVVITHHRMTMSRVDRLFGVTMGEQGVSQLVSVDLGQALELRDIA